MITGLMRVLAEGPATSSEIALELGGNVRNVSARLHQLYVAGRLTRREFHLGADRRTRETVWLYSLPEYRT